MLDDFVNVFLIPLGVMIVAMLLVASVACGLTFIVLKLLH